MVSTSAFFNPVSGASEEANTEAIFTLTGIPQVCACVYLCVCVCVCVCVFTCVFVCLRVCVWMSLYT